MIAVDKARLSLLLIHLPIVALSQLLMLVQRRMFAFQAFELPLASVLVFPCLLLSVLVFVDVAVAVTEQAVEQKKWKKRAKLRLAIDNVLLLLPMIHLPLVSLS